MIAEKVKIFCDGACSGNQYKNNIGGWGAVLNYKDNTECIYGGERNTSNQRMELTACIKALENISISSVYVDVYSDSAYLINCMNDKWYKKWERNNWRNSKKKPVENKDLWIKLLGLVRKCNVSFHKVEGHTGVELNELADSLALKGIKETSGYG